jgi:Arc/MetJ-type ribon-helix-helix transcriptional regulator
MSKNDEFTVIGTRVTKAMYDAIVKLLEKDSHVTVSDYLRDILRRDLEGRGFLKNGLQEAPQKP